MEKLTVELPDGPLGNAIADFITLLEAGGRAADRLGGEHAEAFAQALPAFATALAPVVIAMIDAVETTDAERAREIRDEAEAKVRTDLLG